MRPFLILCLLFVIDTSPFTCADEPVIDKQPIELGLVHWERDLEMVKKLSAATGQPILVLFQEVPG